jgi:hypothetical protein
VHDTQALELSKANGHNVTIHMDSIVEPLLKKNFFLFYRLKETEFSQEGSL